MTLFKANARWIGWKDFFGEVGDTLLVVRFSSLGDVVHTIPAVRYLKESNPKARLIWVVNKGYEPLLEPLPFVDRVIPMFPGREGFKAALSQVRVEKPMVAYDFQGLLKSGLFVFFSGAKERIGLPAHQARESLGSWLLNSKVEVDPTLHVVEQSMMLASKGSAFPTPSFELRVTEGEMERARALLGPLGIRGPYLVFLPGAGWPTKRWPVENFLWLAEMVRDRFSLPSLVLWGPQDEDIVIPLRGESRVKVAPLTTIREMMAILNGGLVVIGGDTGPLHVAAALGRPTLGLYGPSYAWRNGPYGNRSLILEVACSQKGCYKRKCKKECVASIPKEMVWDALQVMLEEEMDHGEWRHEAGPYMGIG